MPINEATIRLGAFIGVFTTMALWEAVAPRRPSSYSRLARWPSNVAIVALNTVLLRILLPATAVSLALLAAQRNWGLLNNLRLPWWSTVVVSVVLLDLATYLQHVMFHAVPALWRLHRMHHADLDIDLTTGARFHPIEIILSMLIKFGVVAALGASAVGVLIFEVLLNATSMFNHGNVRIPVGLDSWLRWFGVTPDMHRIHHSILVGETNSNFGFNLPWWDRLLGTYRDQPAAGHKGMTIGIEQFRDGRELWLDRMLLQPFRGLSVHTPSPGGEQHDASSYTPGPAHCLGGRNRLARTPSRDSSVRGAAARAKVFRPMVSDLVCSALLDGDVLFMPGSIHTVAGGALFGPLWRTLWNLSGATLGAMLAFVIARYIGSDWVARRASERLAGLIRGVEEEGWRFVAFVRLVPLFPFNLVNYAFGLTRIGFSEYVFASFVCMAPGAIAYTYLGYAGLEAASGRAGAIHKALLALALLAAVALMPRLVRRLRGRHYADAANLKQRLESGERVALLDVRTAEEFRGALGHIAGATSIPITEISARLRQLTGIKEPIITI